MKNKLLLVIIKMPKAIKIAMISVAMVKRALASPSPLVSGVSGGKVNNWSSHLVQM